jgi:hypothetical protein
VAGLAAVVAAVTLAPAAQATTACRARPGERVIGRSSEALVLQGRRVVACLRDGRRRYRLDEPPSPEDPPGELDHVVLAGKFVLYEVIDSIGSGGDEYVALVLIDLRTGRSPAVVTFGNQGDRSTEVRRSVLKRNGSFAWVQDSSPAGGALERSVLTCRISTCARGPSRSAQPEVVGQSLGIRPASLRRRGSRVFWIEDGQRRSAPL